MMYKTKFRGILGTMPSGEQQKFGKGSSGKGPTMRSASRSLFKLETAICGCTRALFRLGDLMPFERFRFNKRSQQAGETYDQYKTALRKLAEGCEFHTITPETILRGRLVFGICDVKVREQLLRESQPTLKKTDEICLASESTATQLKEVSEGDSVHSINFRRIPRRTRGKNANKKTDKATNKKNAVILGVFITQITASRAGKHALIAGK